MRRVAADALRQFAAGRERGVEHGGVDVFASADAHCDPRLADARAALVEPRRVRGMLQAAIGADGELCGFVSCAQNGAARLWTLREIALLQRMAVALSVRRSRERPAGAGAFSLPVSRAST